MGFTNGLGGLMKKRKIMTFLILLLSILLTSCNVNNPLISKETVLSDKINTNFQNVDITIGYQGFWGPIEFYLTSPVEIKEVRLDSPIHHTISLEKIPYKSFGWEGYFTQGINFNTEQLSEKDEGLLDGKKLEKISKEYLESSEFNNYFFYKAIVVFDYNSISKDIEPITQMIITSDVEEVMDIGTIQFKQKKDVVKENNNQNILLNRLVSQSFDRYIGATPNRLFDLAEENDDRDQFETTEKIVIDSIEPITKNLVIDKMVVTVNDGNQIRSFSFAEDNLNSMNLELNKNDKLSFRPRFWIKNVDPQVYYVQSYDYIIHYHDVDGNQYAEIVDSGFIGSINDLFMIAANDEVKESIHDYLLTYSLRNQR